MAAENPAVVDIVVAVDTLAQAAALVAAAPVAAAPAAAAPAVADTPAQAVALVEVDVLVVVDIPAQAVVPAAVDIAVVVDCPVLPDLPHWHFLRRSRNENRILYYHHVQLRI